MRIAIAFATLCLFISGKADAVQMLDGSNDADYRALGSTFVGKAAWFQADFTFLDGHVVSFYGSAVRLNSRYGLTAAHNFVSSGATGTTTITKVGTGANEITDPGSVVQVESAIPYPTYLPASGNHYQPDIAIIKFAEPLSGGVPDLDSQRRHQ